MNGLKDKVVLITGGAAGIGEAVVKKFIDEGSIVYIADINDELGKKAEELYKEKDAKYVHLDISNLENWKEVAAKIIEERGHIDVLVNNAGVSQSGLPMETMDLERDWYSLININLNGTFYGMYTFIPYMKEKGGSIVNVSSVSSLIAQCGVTGYTAAKGGINALTRAAAVDYAGYSIRCNAVCPTTTVTPTVEKIFDTLEGVKEALEADCVLPRLGKPEDIANAVAFLASDEASYITGQILPVDGGVTAK
ncbi:MAG: SDR family oxidoreductase [Oscillospiraceae bacterium]|nr:SDR family oxidoreductase [Oscillospiraceae bacterium]